MIQLKRIHDPAERKDGHRILVDRLWPRGVSKDNAQIEQWQKDLAPSTALRRWFDHDPSRWQVFRRRYFEELDTKENLWEPLLDAAGDGALTLVYGARDGAHNNAVALRDYLEMKLQGTRRRARGGRPRRRGVGVRDEHEASGHGATSRRSARAGTGARRTTTSRRASSEHSQAAERRGTARRKVTGNAAGRKTTTRKASGRKAGGNAAGHKTTARKAPSRKTATRKAPSRKTATRKAPGRKAPGSMARSPRSKSTRTSGARSTASRQTRKTKARSSAGSSRRSHSRGTRGQRQR